MTSLGGPVEVRCLGIAFAAGTGAEGEAGMNPESLFYLACDGEIQINSCQSGGPQGAGLQRRGGGEGTVGGGGAERRADSGLSLSEVSAAGLSAGLSHHRPVHTGS